MMTERESRSIAEARARNIVEKLGGRWNGSSGVCRCPAHEDRSPSLSVRLGEQAILFKCFAGCTTREVLNALARDDLYDGARFEAAKTPPPSRDLTALARKIWAESVPIAETLAQRYLEARGLPGVHPRLRFNPRTALGRGKDMRRLPAMIAPVENELGICTIYRTFLDAEDVRRRPFANPKRLLGMPGDGAVRLAPATHELGLAEGIENALAAAMWFGKPVWAVLGAERYAGVTIPSYVRHITIYGDQGEAAAVGLEKALPHLEANGRRVTARIPRHHKDWNDAWRDRGGSPATEPDGWPPRHSTRERVHGLSNR